MTSKMSILYSTHRNPAVCINRPEVGVEVQRINAALIDAKGQAYGDLLSSLLLSCPLLSWSLHNMRLFALYKHKRDGTSFVLCTRTSVN